MGSIHIPRVKLDFSKCAKVCNSFSLSLGLLFCISMLFIFPQKVGSRREEENHHTFEEPKPIQTTVSHFLQNSLQTMNVIRNKRQILMPVSPKKISGNSGTRERIYIDFIADFAISYGWSVIYISLPMDQEEGNDIIRLCEYFTKTLAQSNKGSLKTHCGVGMGNYELLTASSGTKIMPFFSFHFLQNTTSSFSPLHPKLLYPHDPKRPTFVLGGINQDPKLIIEKVRPEFESFYKWTLISPSQEEKDVLMVDDIYGFVGDEPLSQNIGRWSAQNGLYIDTEKAIGLANFQQRRLRVTTVAGPPVVFVERLSIGVKTYGYLPDILDIVSSQLNFTYEMFVPSDNKFGNLEENGSWNGMIGMLQRKEAEIALMSFSLTASRKTIMDFSPPVEYSSVRLLIRRDWKNAEVKWSVFIEPLAIDVWATIPIFICLGVITLSIFSYWKVFEISPMKSTWLLSSCFILQGQDEHSEIKATPYRLVLGTFWVLSVVVFACYTARLTSFLAANNEVLPINSLSQAVKSRSWKVGLVRGSAFPDRIKEARAGVLRVLSKRITEDPSSLVDSMQEGLDRVFKERYIFFTSELIPSYLIRNNCSYTFLPDKFFPGFGYMGYQKNFPLASTISQRIAEVKESGQMRKLIQKWWGSAESSCFTNSGAESFLPMSLYETGTAFLILLMGISFGLALMAMELYSRYRHRNFGVRSSAVSNGSIVSRAEVVQNKNDHSSGSFFLESQFANKFPIYSNKTNFSF